MNKYQEHLTFITQDVRNLKSKRWLEVALASYLTTDFPELNTVTARHEVKNFFDALED